MNHKNDKTLKSRTATYYIWSAMKQRCNNDKHKHYKNWGGRGIKVCDEWNGVHGYQNFLDYMGDKPENMQLDRINNEGNYEPGNVRWATPQQQQLNKRFKSDHPGVIWDKKSRKWRARIGNKHLGFYEEIENAISIYKLEFQKII